MSEPRPMVDVGRVASEPTDDEVLTSGQGEAGTAPAAPSGMDASATSFGLDSWSDDGSFEPPPQLLLAKFAHYVKTQPDKVLFTYLTGRGTEFNKLTYEGVDKRTRNMARNLRSSTSQRGLGLKPGTRVLLVYPPSLDFIIAYLACLRAGIVAVPAYPPDPTKLRKNVRMFASIQASSGAKIALTSRKYNHMKEASIMKDRLKSLFGAEPVQWPDIVWVTTEPLTGVAPEDGHEGLDAATGDDIAFLQYTSGSTAEPKGVMVSHGNLAHNLTAITRSLHAKDDTVVVSWLPQYHDMGLIGSHLGVIYCGGSGVYMSPLSYIKNPPVWIKAVSVYRGTHLQAPSFAYALTVRKFKEQKRFKLQDLDLSCVRHVFNAAEPIDPVAMMSFLTFFAPAGLKARAMSPGYGLAEHTVFVCDKGRNIVTVDKDTLEREGRVVVRDEVRLTDTAATSLVDSEAEDDATTLRLVGCGYPRRSHDIEVVIVNPSTRAVMLENHVGEIWVNSPSKALGYWGKEELTADTFHAMPSDPPPKRRTNADAAGAGAGAGDGAGAGAGVAPAGSPPPHDGYLRTGDLGFFHNNELFVCGRHKDLVIIRGRNHYPHDLEATVQSDAALRPGCVSAFSIGMHGSESLVILAELRDPKMAKGDRERVAAQARVNVRREHGVTPATVMLLPPHTVPKTTSGKIARQWGKKAFEDGSLAKLCLYDLTAPAVVDSGDWGQEAPSVDVRDWDDAKLRLALVDTVAMVAEVDVEAVVPSEPLSTHMDSLLLFQLHQMLASKYGLYIGDEDMFAERTSIEWIVNNRMVLSVPRDNTHIDTTRAEDVQAATPMSERRPFRTPGDYAMPRRLANDPDGGTGGRLRPTPSTPAARAPAAAKSAAAPAPPRSPARKSPAATGGASTPMSHDPLPASGQQLGAAARRSSGASNRGDRGSGRGGDNGGKLPLVAAACAVGVAVVMAVVWRSKHGKWGCGV